MKMIELNFRKVLRKIFGGISLTDMDGDKNGYFADTTLIVNYKKKNEIIINVDLREIQ
jgi:hypothetical protein